MSIAPTSKVQAGGAGAVVAGAIIAIAAQVGYPLPDWAVGLLPVILTLAMAYLVPHSMQDKVNMVTTDVIAAAQAVGKLPPPQPAALPADQVPQVQAAAPLPIVPTIKP